jgi:hypothetical protein
LEIIQALGPLSQPHLLVPQTDTVSVQGMDDNVVGAVTDSLISPMPSLTPDA